MKKIVMMLVSVFALHADEKQIFNAPDLGKTHFIVGFPEQAQDTKEQSPPVSCMLDPITKRLRCSDGSIRQVLFSPDDNLKEILISLINNEQHGIKIAIYSFTDGDIAKAVIQAHKRGVPVEVVVDSSYKRDKFSKIPDLKSQRIKVYVYDTDNKTILNDIMHNKFVLLKKNIDGKSIVWSGSFNFTKSAQINNQENVLVLDDIKIITKYEQQFEILKRRTKEKAALKTALKKKRAAKYLVA